MSCEHGVARWGGEGRNQGGPIELSVPSACERCDGRERMQHGLVVGMRVRIEDFNIDPVEGVVEAIDPCDGNSCEHYPHPGSTCLCDYVIVEGEPDVAFVRSQVELVLV